MDFDVLDGLKKNVACEIETAFRKGYSQGVEHGYNEARACSYDRYNEGWEQGYKDALNRECEINCDYKFQVGDEVKYIETEDTPIIVTRVKVDHFEGISSDGETFEWLEYGDFEKTGKHFKIEVTEI